MTAENTGKHDVVRHKSHTDPKWKLTDRELRFADEYLIDFDATNAMMRSGNFTSKPAARQYAHKVLAKPEMSAYLAHRRQLNVVKSTKSAQDIIAELEKIGFSNMQDFVESVKEGDFSKLTREQMAAVHELSMETEFVKVDKDHKGPPPQVRRVKLKLYNKRDALVDLGKHHGIFKENKDVLPPDFEFTVSIGTRSGPNGSESVAQVSVRPALGVPEAE